MSPKQQHGNTNINGAFIIYFLSKSDILIEMQKLVCQKTKTKLFRRKKSTFVRVFKINVNTFWQ